MCVPGDNPDDGEHPPAGSLEIAPQVRWATLRAKGDRGLFDYFRKKVFGPHCYSTPAFREGRPGNEFIARYYYIH